MADVIYAPNRMVTDYDYQHILFLGGSIEMGAVEDWQARVIRAINYLPVLILNPRHPDWDASLPQDPTPGTEFHKQVNWELDAQEYADVHVYYFHPDTKAPITLLELGLFAICKRVHVYCPTTFWRYGNVKIICDRMGHICHTDEDSFLGALVQDVS